MTLKNNDYILENKLGIKDIFILNEHERKIATFNEIIIRRKNYKKFNFNTLKSMHKELFKEISLVVHIIKIEHARHIRLVYRLP